MTRKKEKNIQQQRRRVGLKHQHAPNTTSLKQLSLIGLGRQLKPHNTSPKGNNARLDWNADMDETTSLEPRLTTFSISCSYRWVQHCAERKREKQTAPYREGHRYMGPTAVVPLQHHTTTSDTVKPT